MINANRREFRIYIIILRKESSYELIEINICISWEIMKYEFTKMQKSKEKNVLRIDTIIKIVMKIKDL